MPIANLHKRKENGNKNLGEYYLLGQRFLTASALMPYIYGQFFSVRNKIVSATVVHHPLSRPVANDIVLFLKCCLEDKTRQQ